MGNYWSSLSSHRIGIDQYLYSQHTDRHMDRLPGHWCHWSGEWHSNGTRQTFFRPDLYLSGSLFVQPLVAVQNSLPQSQIAVSMALLIFFQTIGGSLWLSFAETTFNSGLQNALTKYAPDISPEEVASAGASGIRLLIPEANVEGVIMSYNEAIQHVFWLAAGVGAIGFFFSLGLGWKSVKKPKVVAPKA